MEEFKSLKGHVYDYIADQIQKGNLRPEDKINELAICSELKISRTPVREALIQLAAEGVLENLPRRGFVVRKLGLNEAHNLYVVIGVLDGLAAELACDKLTDKDLKDMRFYMQCINLAIESANYEMYYKQQLIFHQTYIDKCGNPTLISTLNQLKNKFLHKSYEDDGQGRLKRDLLQTNEEHGQIIELFRQKKAQEVNDYIAKIHWDPGHSDLDLF